MELIKAPNEFLEKKVQIFRLCYIGRRKNIQRNGRIDVEI